LHISGKFLFPFPRKNKRIFGVKMASFTRTRSLPSAGRAKSPNSLTVPRRHYESFKTTVDRLPQSAAAIVKFFKGIIARDGQTG
jgi:hypothetical protein